MKKILITLFILTSMIMFMFINLSFEEKDVSDVSWLFGLNEKEHITLELEGDLRIFDSRNFVELMYDIHAQTEVTLVSNYSDYATKTEEYYIISDEPLDQMFDLTIYGFILNDTHELIHLSTHNSVDKQMKINLINKEIQLDIYSYNYFAQKDNYPSVSFYYEDESQLLKIQSIVEESLGEYNPQYIDHVQGFYDYKTEIKDQILYLLVLAIALLFSSLLFFVSTSLYEIGIYKLQGYPSSRIIKMLLFKEVLISIALSIVAVILLFIFRIGFISKASVELMLVFLKYFSLLILLFVGVLFGFVMLVRFIRLSDIIKGRNLGKYFASLIYLIKVLTVLAIIPVISIQSTNIFESIHQLNTLSDTEHYFEDIYSIHGFKDLIRDKEYFFPELGNDTENPEYLKHLKMLKDYQELNAFYMHEEWVMIDPRDESRDFFPLVIDSNFLKHDLGLHTFEKDVNDLLKENDIVILYDETTEADKIEAVIKRYTEEKVKAVTITMPNNVFVIDKEIPEIVIVMKSDVDRVDKTIFNNMYFYDIDKDAIERVAKKYDFDDMFDIVDYKDHVKDRKSNIITPLMKDMLYLLMSLAVLLTIAYSFFIAYKRTKLQTINVQKLLGYPIWYIYFDYLLESVLSYVLLFILLRDKFYSYMKYIIVIELLIYGLIYIQNKYQKIHIELKKEEI